MMLAIAHRRAPWLGARRFPRASKAQAEIKTAGRQGIRRGGALWQSLIVRRNLITILSFSFKLRFLNLPLVQWLVYCSSELSSIEFSPPSSLLKIMSIRVLIACEASGKTCCAFRRLGYTAFSCDIQDTYGTHPEWHIKSDALEVINDNWDLIISHPPCTFLSRCQGNLIFDRVNGASIIKDSNRYSSGLQAADFFMKMLNAPAPFVCVENPRPLKIWGLPKPSCTIQPFEFGHPYTKATCLWLKGLPPLMPTDLFDPSVCRSWMRCVPGFSKRTKYKKVRLCSETFQGISDALAIQYGSFVSASLSQPSASSMVGV